ncbi:hypothetical protein GCM10010385_68900 [Streptomyces geysiriensis]|nr:hypothetical protein GCM10010385_68900 [Streptomyces geysiriensis]GHC44552.1 hypothetical protein GCM10010308_74770 [Streptomyces vinaceusdrappus]
MPRKIRYPPDRVPRTSPAPVRTLSPTAAPAGAVCRASAAEGGRRAAEAQGADIIGESVRADTVIMAYARR